MYKQKSNESTHRIRIVAGCLERRGLVQLVSLVLLRVFVLEQVEPVLLLSPTFLTVAGHFGNRLGTASLCTGTRQPFNAVKPLNPFSPSKRKDTRLSAATKRRLAASLPGPR